MTIELGIALTVISAAIAVAGFYLGRRSETKQAGKSEGVVLTEIGYVKSGIDDIKRKQAEQDEKHVALLSRVIAVEASTKQAHRRISDMVGRDQSREE